jgi:hypothetical protein
MSTATCTGFDRLLERETVNMQMICCKKHTQVGNLSPARSQTYLVTVVSPGPKE